MYNIKMENTGFSKLVSILIFAGPPDHRVKPLTRPRGLTGSQSV